MELKNRFLNFIKSDALAYDDQRKLLLGVSGGVDSMVMLDLFVECGFEVAVAHCNFQLRERESDSDQEFVESQASRLGVECHSIRFATQKEVERSGESVQMVARRLRYDWFSELIDAFGYQGVAVAHHADDSIETFFINLFRGSGLRGLSGIKVRNGNVMRPLLSASREDIERYAERHKIEYREDASNASQDYLRNKIRHTLSPVVEEILPEYISVMEGNFGRLAEAQEFVDNRLDEIAKRVVSGEEDGVVFEISGLKGDEFSPFVIYNLLNKYGFNRDVTDSIFDAVCREVSGREFHSNSHKAYLDRGNVVLVERSLDVDFQGVEVTGVGEYRLSNDERLIVELLPRASITTIQQPPNIALLDGDKVEFPLEVRLWQSGDAFVPFGMEGRKKVSDLLVDAKVARYDKKWQKVVVSRGEIVWVVGRRIDDGVKIGSETKKVLKLTLKTDRTNKIEG